MIAQSISIYQTMVGKGDKLGKGLAQISKSKPVTEAHSYSTEEDEDEPDEDDRRGAPAFSLQSSKDKK